MPSAYAASSAGSSRRKLRVWSKWACKFWRTAYTSETTGDSQAHMSKISANENYELNKQYICTDVRCVRMRNFNFESPQALSRYAHIKINIRIGRRTFYQETMKLLLVLFLACIGCTGWRKCCDRDVFGNCVSCPGWKACCWRGLNPICKAKNHGCNIMRRMAKENLHRIAVGHGAI